MRYALRPATEADRDFLYRLHVATIKEYVEPVWGWDDAFQEARFRQRFDPDECQVIAVDREDVGVLQVERRETEVFLGNIRIAPGRQRRGLGTAVIQGVLAQAERDGLPVALQVLKVNPAKRLYKRLGFVVVQETPTHYVMLKE